MAVRQEEWFSQFPAQHLLLSKALVGEHKALSFLFVGHGHDLNSPCSPVETVRTYIAFTHTRIFFIQIFLNMRFYINLAILALAASTAPLALSAPTQSRYGNLLVEFKGS